jgi:CheY-like chemotaxis protein/anti-sigma factor ChrR (cupin superfamily)
LRSALEAYSNIEVVGEAADGEAAVLSAARLQPTAVVMDINMSKMDGITATRLIKRQNPQIAVVCVSVNPKDYQVYAMEKAGAFKILSKDSAVTELYGAIQEAVAALRPVLVQEPGEQLDDPDQAGMSKEVKRPATLGDVLYAKSYAPIPEQDWATLVQSIAAGDQLALHELYDRAQHPVFTLIMRITSHRETAEELTIDVFHDIWRRASRYDAGNGTVLGWIMNEARSRAIHRLESENVSCPSNVLRPSASVQARLALRIAEETNSPPVLPTARWTEPEWEQVAPGIECKLLATDTQRHQVSMLVRLAPGASYPGHTHAGREELHLLEGELWIDQRKLSAGDYNYAEPGTGDDRVWSETGCTCVLITSIKDILR